MAGPKKRGRPTKRVPRTLSHLEEALTKGLPRWAACAYAKISRETFNQWLKEPEFENKVLGWEARSMFALVEGVKEESHGKQFLLSRRFRSDYGEHVEIEHSGAITVEYTNDWRSNSASIPTSWSADSTESVPAV